MTQIQIISYYLQIANADKNCNPNFLFFSGAFVWYRQKEALATTKEKEKSLSIFFVSLDLKSYFGTTKKMCNDPFHLYFTFLYHYIDQDRIFNW